MKTTISLCLATSLILGNVASAHADWERHHHNHRQPPAHHYNSPRGDWAGPAALLAITGLAIGAAYSQINTAPPPPSVQLTTPPDSGNWYYCASSRQYYPHIRYCPEGWQAITPPR